MSGPLESKIDLYKVFLRERYWEIREAVYLLNGCTAFECFYNLEPTIERIIERKCFSVIPEDSFLDKTSEQIQNDNFEYTLQKLYKFIKNDRVTNLPIQLRCMEYLAPKSCPFLRNHTYFLSSDDILAIAVTEGIALPLELQIASGLRQVSNSSPLSISDTKEIQRQAVAQMFWYKYPKESICGICSRMESLRGAGRFKFLHDSQQSQTRARVLAKSIKPINANELPHIPHIIDRQEESVVFDFAKLKIALSALADLVLIDHVESPFELLSHPLIALYAPPIQVQSATTEIAQ
jgi:hypothetical protein